MTLPRRGRLALGALSVVLLFGILGLAWWWWRYASGRRPAGRFPRVRTGLLAAGVVVIAIGSVARLMPVFESVPTCAPPGGSHASTRARPLEVSLVAQQAATWPETGLGLLFSRTRGAHVCLSRSADYLVAVHVNNIAGMRAMNMGDIVLSPGFQLSRDELYTLAQHEARHRAQWSVGTAIAGPFAFPVTYGIVDFFFPGSRNPFERQAGLASGGYRHVGYGPVLGPAQLAVLGGLALLIIAVLVRARVRRAAPPHRVDDPDPAPQRE